MAFSDPCLIAVDYYCGVGALCLFVSVGAVVPFQLFACELDETVGVIDHEREQRHILFIHDKHCV